MMATHEREARGKGGWGLIFRRVCARTHIVCMRGDLKSAYNCTAHYSYNT